jgi:hypothetical protein
METISLEVESVYNRTFSFLKLTNRGQFASPVRGILWSSVPPLLADGRDSERAQRGVQSAGEMRGCGAAAVAVRGRWRCDSPGVGIGNAPFERESVSRQPVRTPYSRGAVPSWLVRAGRSVRPGISRRLRKRCRRSECRLLSTAPPPRDLWGTNRSGPSRTNEVSCSHEPHSTAPPPQTAHTPPQPTRSLPSVAHLSLARRVARHSVVR